MWLFITWIGLHRCGFIVVSERHQTVCTMTVILTQQPHVTLKLSSSNKLLFELPMNHEQVYASVTGFGNTKKGAICKELTEC